MLLIMDVAWGQNWTEWVKLIWAFLNQSSVDLSQFNQDTNFLSIIDCIDLFPTSFYNSTKAYPDK